MITYKTSTAGLADGVLGVVLESAEGWWRQVSSSVGVIQFVFNVGVFNIGVLSATVLTPCSLEAYDNSVGAFMFGKYRRDGYD